MLSRIQPHLLGKPPKKPVKKVTNKLDPLVLQFSPTGFRLLSPEKLKRPAKRPAKRLGKRKELVKPVSPTQGRTIGRARKVPAVAVGKPGRKLQPVRKKAVVE